MRQRILNRKGLIFLLTAFGSATAVAAASSFAVNDAHAVGEASSAPVAEYILGGTVTDTDNGFDVTPAHGAVPVTYTYASHAQGWAAAVAASVSESGSLVKVRLASGWTAESVMSDDETTVVNTSFGEGTGFYNGGLCVENGSNILLDLNGFNIDRGLSELGAVQNGSAIFVNWGLTLVDESTGDSGKVTGGNTVDYGGGIYGAVGSVININGGEISGNSAGEGGAGLFTDATVSMTAGKISDNTAVSGVGSAMGGGVMLRGTQSKFLMSGGEVSGNSATGGAQGGAYGGGIYVERGRVELTGDAKVTANKLYAVYSGSPNSVVMGGGVYLDNRTQATMLLDEDAEISDNELYRQAVGDTEYTLGGYAYTNQGSTYGGGVYVKGAATFDMKGGKISGNVAGQSGAVQVDGTFNLSGGEITENKAVFQVGGIDFVSYTSTGARGLRLSGNPKVLNNYAKQTDSNAANSVAFYDKGEIWYNSNIHCDSGYNYLMAVVGELTEGADIHYVNVGAAGQIKTVGYAENNSVKKSYPNGDGTYTEYEIPVDPAKYFHSDKEGMQIVLSQPYKTVTGTGNVYLPTDASGNPVKEKLDTYEITELASTPSFVAGYGDTPEAVSGYYGAEYEYSEGVSLSSAFTYGGTEPGVTITKGGVQVDSVSEAGVYKLTATVAPVTNQYVKASGESANVSCNVDVVFTVVILPKELTNENTSINVTSTHTYNGEAQSPAYTLSLASGTQLTGNDYTAELKNNINAGEGDVVVTYKGNYQGVVTYKFAIAQSTGETYTSAIWQYYNRFSDGVGGNWATIATDAPFVYDTLDHSMDLRVGLVVGSTSTVVWVYANPAEGDTVEEDRVNETNMYLTYEGTFDGATVSNLLNAATYTVTIAGTPNYAFATGVNTTQIKISPVTFEFDAEDFFESADKRLWVLDLGNGATSHLRDGADTTYFDPTAAANPDYDGATVVTGKADDVNAFVRYTGAPSTIVLNDDYSIGGNTIGNYKTSAITVEYVNNAATGTRNEVIKVTTTARLNFNGNFVTQDNKNYIELTKEWYIVTINNALRNQGKGDENVSVAGWTFGDVVTQSPFRPEHGDTVIYTVKQGETEISRFAVIYSDNATMGANEAYYELNEDGTVDRSRQIYVFDYYAKVLEGLDAGNYELNVRIPAYTATANHTLWWSADEQEYEGAVYYPISCTFNFKVSPFALSRTNVGLAAGEGIAVVINLSDDRVSYNGSANNLPEASVTFNGVLLKAGEEGDYTLSSVNVNAGEASITITGVGNFSGRVTIANAYTITQAVNGWAVLPGIMNWTYGGYRYDVNLITGAPWYGNGYDIVYRVAYDEAGLDTVEGLEAFSLNEDGQVDGDVALALSGLDARTYYLFASLPESEDHNYYAIEEVNVRFEIAIIENWWVGTPNVIQWSYDAFDAATNLFTGVPRIGDEVEFRIYRDENCADIIVTFANVSEVEETLKALPAGRYYFKASVAGVFNQYTELSYDDIEPIAFDIAQGHNAWTTSLDVIGWEYNGYAVGVNRILGEVTHGTITYKLTNSQGEVVRQFTTVEGDEELQKFLNELPAGNYTLTASVSVPANYAPVEQSEVTLTVSQAFNEWVYSPSIESWITGRYDENTNVLNAQPKFGKVTYIIREAGNEENVIFDSARGINKLNEAGVGLYQLVASVAGTDNYHAISEFTFTFRIFEQPGIPWWGTLLIALGALLIAAIIIFILWKKGVFQILTGKIVLAIRTRANVDATIASVRAARMMEEGRKSVEDAKRRERLEELRHRSQTMAPEERAAALEAKAQMQAEKAEQLRTRSEKMMNRVERMRKKSDKEAASVEDEEPAIEEAAVADEAPTTEEAPVTNEAPATEEPVAEETAATDESAATEDTETPTEE